MRTPFLAAAAVLGLLLPTVSLADIPVPGQPFRPRGPIERQPAEDNSIPMPVVVKREALKHENVREARTIKAKIIIPRGFLPAEKPVEIEKQGSTRSNTGTIVAGIALSLAAISCVFLVRKSRTGRIVAMGVIVIACGAGIWSAAVADIAPRARPVENIILLEVVEEGESITLILPK